MWYIARVTCPVDNNDFKTLHSYEMKKVGPYFCQT